MEHDIGTKSLLIAFSEFAVLAVNWATAVTNKEFVKSFYFFKTFL